MNKNMKNKESKKSRLVALLLAWFLGIFGAHYFYVGRNKKGIIMIVLTVSIIGMFASSIWAFIDLIRIASGNFVDKDELQLKSWN